MGTSSSYSGSGGSDWSHLQEELEDWLDSLPGAPADETPSDTEAPGEEPTLHQSDEPEDEVVRVLRPLAAALLAGGRGSADGPSAGAGLGLRTATGGGRSPSGTGRSRARAGRVGGRLAAGLSALRTGDAAALAELGLDLTELRALDPFGQAQRILAVATEEETATTLEEEELHTSANRTAIWALTADNPPDVEDVIRYFVVEYVYEVFLTEGGPALRSGNRNGVNAISAEDRVKQTITALVQQAPIDPKGMAPGELAQVVEQVLQQSLSIHGGAE